MCSALATGWPGRWYPSLLHELIELSKVIAALLAGKSQGQLVLQACACVSGTELPGHAWTCRDCLVALKAYLYCVVYWVPPRWSQVGQGLYNGGSRVQ